jgi:hypothetical protein
MCDSMTLGSSSKPLHVKQAEQRDYSKDDEFGYYVSSEGLTFRHQLQTLRAGFLRQVQSANHHARRHVPTDLL